MKLILLAALFMTNAQDVASEKCTSEQCCHIDLPEGYCGLTLPNEPMDITTMLFVKNLEEVNEVKLSYTINVR